MNRRSFVIYEPKTLSENMTKKHTYYETMYILRPDIAEEEVTNHIEKYNKLLQEFGGSVLDSQMRGKRRLAYQIAKHKEGVYVQLSHQGDGQHIFKIEKAMRLSEDVIRYMTIKQDGPLPTPKQANKSPEKSEKKEDDKIESIDKKEDTKKSPNEKELVTAKTSSDKSDSLTTENNSVEEKTDS